MGTDAFGLAPLDWLVLVLLFGLELLLPSLYNSSDVDFSGGVLLAERAGFEPAMVLPIRAFQTRAIDQLGDLSEWARLYHSPCSGKL
jgi:hypothetical protein